jgi:hypothetical protein
MAGADDHDSTPFGKKLPTGFVEKFRVPSDVVRQIKSLTQPERMPPLLPTEVHEAIALVIQKRKERAAIDEAIRTTEQWLAARRVDPRLWAAPVEPTPEPQQENAEPEPQQEIAEPAPAQQTKPPLPPPLNWGAIKTVMLTLKISGPQQEEIVRALPKIYGENIAENLDRLTSGETLRTSELRNAIRVLLEGEAQGKRKVEFPEWDTCKRFLEAWRDFRIEQHISGA